MRKLVFVVLFVLSVAFSFYSGFHFSKSETVSASCILRDTEIRENPTGYIIAKIPTGSAIWINEIRAPFAYVSYLNNNQWVEGTITASYIGLCEAQ